MAAEIIPGCAPAPDCPSSEFATSTVTALKGHSPALDPIARALMCCQRARDCLQAARAARECGHGDVALRCLKRAEALRMAAAAWRQRARAGRVSP
jgi:hypothetical protein